MNIKDLLPQEKAERERQELKEMPDNELNILTQIFSLVYDPQTRVEKF